MNDPTVCLPVDPVVAYLGLGSNLGDRHELIASAVEMLAAQSLIRLRGISSLYESAPVGGPSGQPDFFNLVLEAETGLSADALLTTAWAIEQRLGRRRSIANGPRTLDIDILAYGDQDRTTPRLVLPHPRLHLRRFVLAPLVEIAAAWIHPGLERRADELLAALPSEPTVVRIGPLDRVVHLSFTSGCHSDTGC